MTNHELERWLLPLLARVRTRPGMFLGDERVETLATFLAGYEQGRADVGGVGMHDDDALLLNEFDAWLAERTERHGSQGALRWPQLVGRLDEGPKNVRTFFDLLEEFLESAGRSLNSASAWSPSGWQPDPSSVKEK